MDLTRNAIFRNFRLNDEDIQDSIDSGSDIGDGIEGCTIDTADMSDVDVVQWLEKKALQDGLDAGDVYLGQRRVRLAGTLYGKTRGLLFDAFAELGRVLSATSCFREAPDDKGYIPLYFSRPTNRQDDFPSGVIDLRINVLPRAFQANFNRKASGGDDGDALAIPWQSVLVMREPMVQGANAQDYELEASSGGHVYTGTLSNRGTYHMPLNGLFYIGSAAGTIEVAAGDALFTLTIPSGSGNRTIRYKGFDKVVTLQNEDDATDALAIYLYDADNINTYALVPTGDSEYTVTVTGCTVLDGSHLWFYEGYAA